MPLFTGTCQTVSKHSAVSPAEQSTQGFPVAAMTDVLSATRSVIDPPPAPLNLQVLQAEAEDEDGTALETD